MMRSASLTSALLLVSCLASSSPARAQEAFAGSFAISKADTAPWADAAPKPDAELRGLLGKSASFQKTRIDAPKPLGCAKLQYAVKEYTADMLFQGSLKEPEQQAKALGFKGTPIKTLETGCANGIDFHMVDADTVLFGLNDRVYTLTRKKP